MLEFILQNFDTIATSLLLALALSYLWHHLNGYKVLDANDGDGLKINMRYDIFGRKVQKIRLYGIDAPEMFQPGGEASRNALRKLVVGRTVRIKFNADSHDRWVCRVYLWPFIDLAAWQVLNGWAWNYKEYGGRYFWQQWVAQFLCCGIWKNGTKGVVYPETARRLKEQGKVVAFPALKQVSKGRKRK